MPDIGAEIARLRTIDDPVRRSVAALEAIEEARELQQRLGQVRGLAVYEVYAKHGAAKAARLLGISRAGLYRIIAEHAPPEVKQRRAETLVLVMQALADANAELQRIYQDGADNRASGTGAE